MNYNLSRYNNQSHLSIPTGNLRVTPYDVEQFWDVKIHQKLNEHSTLYFKGLLRNVKAGSPAEISTKGSSVSLSFVDMLGDEYILFQGVVQDVQIQITQDTRHIEVHAISYSYLLDVKVKSRSFQDKGKSYTSLINQIAAEYNGAEVKDVASKGAPTNKFIIQHAETDWAFIKRMASRFYTGLVCDVRFNTPMCFMGLPGVQALKLDNCNYSVKKDMQLYKHLSKNGVTGLHEQDFICYEVETSCVARIGDKASFQQKQLFVAEINSSTDKGLFTSRLVLMPKKGLSQLRQSNAGIVGASFGGRVLEAKNDTVKVQLAIDQGHNSGAPCFFPYSTIYSSQSGSGWYCMPEIGDTVRLYCPDGEDDHAYIISSVHEQVDPELSQQTQKSAGAANNPGGGAANAGGYSGLRDDPNVKSLTYGDKEIRLAPEGVYIMMDGSMITMTEDGIVLMSENDIAFKSEKNIYLCAEEDVSIVGNASVEIMSGETTGVMIEDNVQVIGQEVRAN